MMLAEEDFQRRIDAIRDLAADAHTSAAGLDSRPKLFHKSVRVWNYVDTDEAINTIFERAVEELAEHLERAIKEESTEDSGNLTLEALAQPILLRLSSEFSKMEGSQWRFYNAWTRSINRGSRSDEMYASLLVSAAGAFEVLVADSFRAYLTATPEALRNTEKQFSYTDVTKHSSMDDFRSACIEQLVNKKMYGSMRSWFEWLDKQARMPLEDMLPDDDELVEVFARRNLVVHNSGRANEIYMESVRTTAHTFKIGDRLAVDRQYLNRALDKIQALGHATAYGIYKSVTRRIPSRDGLAESLAGDRSFELLSHSHHTAVVELCNRVLALNPEIDRTSTIRVNRWIAMKELDGVESINQELSSWDTADLPRRFELARLTLLDEHGRALDLLLKLVDEDEIRAFDWHGWPLFKDLRKYVQASELRDSLPPSLIVAPHDGGQ